MRRFGMRMAVLAAGCSMVAGAVMTTAGCGMAEGLIAVRDEAVRTRAEIAEDRDGLLAAAAVLPAGSARRAKIEGLAAERMTQEAAFSRVIEQLDAARATGSDPAGTIESGASILAPLFPPGAQLPLILGAGFAASVWRAVRLKKSAASIAEGLEKAMMGDEGLREGLKRNAATLRSVQTPTAQRIVDEVKRARPMVRLPL